MSTGYLYLDLEILNHLGPKDILSLSFVNKYFRTITFEFRNMYKNLKIELKKTDKKDLPLIDKKLYISCKNNYKWLASCYIKKIFFTDIKKEALKICYLHGNFELAKSLLTYAAIDDNINQYFGALCRYGKFYDAKIFYEKHKDCLNIHAFDEYAFGWACQNGHFDIAKWLYNLKNINMTICHYQAFRGACSNGHLDIAKWYLEKVPDMNINIMCNDAFTLACKNKHDHIMHWLLNISSNMNNNEYYVFRGIVYSELILCNKLDILKLILKLVIKSKVPHFIEYAFNDICSETKTIELLDYMTNIDVNQQCRKYAFIKACGNKNQLAAKYLLLKYNLPVDQLLNYAYFHKKYMVIKYISETKPENYTKCLKYACKSNEIYIVDELLTEQQDFNLNDVLTRNYKCYNADILDRILKLKKVVPDINHLFLACKSGDVPLLDWIYNNNKSIDISENDHYAFKIACKNKHLSIIKYLCNINPNYDYEYIPNIKN